MIITTSNLSCLQHWIGWFEKVYSEAIANFTSAFCQNIYLLERKNDGLYWYFFYIFLVSYTVEPSWQEILGNIVAMCQPHKERIERVGDSAESITDNMAQSNHMELNILTTPSSYASLSHKSNRKNILFLPNIMQLFLFKLKHPPCLKKGRLNIQVTVTPSG